MSFDELIHAIQAGESVSLAAAVKQLSPADRSIALLAAADFQNRAAALLLLDAGASPLFQDLGTLQSALLLAVAHRDEALVARLLAAKAPVDARDSTGTSPLLLAVLRDDLALIKALVAAGADLNLRSHQRGDSPLAQAALQKNPAACQFLIDAGADLETTDHNDLSPLGGALLAKQYACVELLVKRGAFVHEDARAQPAPLQRLLDAHADHAEFERRATLDTLFAAKGIAGLAEVPKLLKWPSAARELVVRALTTTFVELVQANDKKGLSAFAAGWCQGAKGIGFRRDFLTDAEATLVSSLVAVSCGDEALENAVLANAVPFWVPPALAFNLACLFAKRGERERAIYFARIAIDSGAKDASDFRADADFEALLDDHDFSAALDEPQFVLERGGPFEPDINAITTSSFAS